MTQKEESPVAFFFRWNALEWIHTGFTLLPLSPSPSRLWHAMMVLEVCLCVPLFFLHVYLPSFPSFHLSFNPRLLHLTPVSPVVLWYFWALSCILTLSIKMSSAPEQGFKPYGGHFATPFIPKLHSLPHVVPRLSPRDDPSPSPSHSHSHSHSSSVINVHLIELRVGNWSSPPGLCLSPSFVFAHPTHLFTLSFNPHP